MIICVYGAASDEIAEPFKKTGHALGYQLAQRGHSLVFGGGDHGMMGAVARGVHDGGGHITGIQPGFFNVDGVLYPLCDEYIYTDTMRERKQMMEDKSDAFIVTPGGVGTYEEFFEILTLKQLGRHRKPIVILNTDGYYDPMLQMIKIAIGEKFINEKNLSLFYLTDEVTQALDYVENPAETEYSIETLRNL